MRSQSRREFLCRTIPAAVATGTALAVGPFLYSQAPPPAVTRQGYTGSRLALELDGQFAGWLKSASGGRALADVVTEGTTVNGIQRKHLAGVKYEDIVLTCGTGMSPHLYEWIKASFDKQPIRRSGSLVECDFNYKAQSRENWFNTSISEIAFPACDAASREPGNFTIKLTPEWTSWTKDSGAALPGAPTVPAKNQLWLPGNFRLRITGLDCSGVNNIEAITYKSAPNISAISVGTARNGTSGVMQFPSLVVTLPEARAAGFVQWFQASVVQGNATSDPGRPGLLEYLDPSLRESLFSISFLGLGIKQLTPEKVSAGSEQVRLVKAEMYYKDLRFAYGAAASA
jgi:hypothetical protein